MQLVGNAFSSFSWMLRERRALLPPPPGRPPATHYYNRPPAFTQGDVQVRACVAVFGP